MVQNAARPPIAYGAVLASHRDAGAFMPLQAFQEYGYADHKHDLAGFYPDVEHQERQRHFILRQPDFCKRTCESEPVHEAETKCDEPWKPLRESQPATGLVQCLYGKQENTE